MSPAVLEAQRGREPGDADQSRLFDDLRRPTPARATSEREPESAASGIRAPATTG